MPSSWRSRRRLVSNSANTPEHVEERLTGSRAGVDGLLGGQPSRVPLVAPQMGVLRGFSSLGVGPGRPRHLWSRLRKPYSALVPLLKFEGHLELHAVKRHFAVLDFNVLRRDLRNAKIPQSLRCALYSCLTSFVPRLCARSYELNDFVHALGHRIILPLNSLLRAFSANPESAGGFSISDWIPR